MSIADLPYEHAIGDGGPRSMTQMVVIHATDNTASDEAEASYATHRTDHTSAHFYDDDDSVIRALPLDHIAYGCFSIGNGRSVQFELTGLSNHISDATMRRVAPIVAEVCEIYGLPIRHVGPVELRAGDKGICGHGDVTAAWGQGDHTDPGSSFPWDTFIGYVQAAAGVATATNPSATVHEEDEEMHVELSMSGQKRVGATSLSTSGGESFVTAQVFWGDAEAQLYILPKGGSWQKAAWTNSETPAGTDIRDGKVHRWLGTTELDAWSVELLSTSRDETFVAVDTQRKA